MVICKLHTAEVALIDVAREAEVPILGPPEPTHWKRR